MAFGERLQLLRRSSGLTQEQFAEQLQVSRQAVSKWESGKGYPEVEKLLFICRQYHVTLNDLFEQGESAPISRETAPAGSLRTSVSAFFNNLSPRNKWLAGGILLGVALLAEAAIPSDQPCTAIPSRQIVQLATIIKHFKVPVSATRSFEQAQVTAGGVAVDEVCADTMESKLVDGLYFAGEMLDVDGICGGFNLQWAWSSGAIAGRHAASMIRTGRKQS